MKIVIDTNVVISAVFFGGIPQTIIEMVKNKKIFAFATPEIVLEYKDIIQEMINRKQGKFCADRVSLFTDKLNIVEDVSIEPICRDSDDDKFIACAVQVAADYIISGDKDLLCLEKYNSIEIISASDFVKKLINN